MNKCQHNEKIEFFCIHDGCSHKDAGGCSKCIKKHHTHSREPRVLNQEEAQSIIRKFTSDHSNKPNCRTIQEGIYKHFSNIKTELNSVISDIEIACKTIVNQIGYPFLHENDLVNVFKKLKHKEYKKVTKKQFQKFYEASRSISPAEFALYESKIYKENLKKNRKFLTDFQTLMNSSEKVFKCIFQSYSHQKQTFHALSQSMKDTINQTTSLIQKQSEELSRKAQQLQYLERASKHMKHTVAKERPSEVPAEKYKQTFGLKDGVFSPPFEQVSKKAFVPKENFKVQSQSSQSNPSPNKVPIQAQNNFKIAFKDILKDSEKDSKQLVKKHSSREREISLDKKIEHEKRKTVNLLEQIQNEVSNHKKMWRQEKTKRETESSIGKDNGMVDFNAKDYQISARKEELINIMRQQSKTERRESDLKFTQKNKEDIKLIFNTETSKSPKESPLKKSDSSYKDAKSHRNSVESPHIEKKSELNSSSVPSDSVKSSAKHQQQLTKLHEKELFVFSIENSNQSSVMARSSVEKSMGESLLKSEQAKIQSSTQQTQRGRILSHDSSSLENLKNLKPKQSQLNHHINLSPDNSETTEKLPAGSRIVIVPHVRPIPQRAEECDSPLLKKKNQKRKKCDFFSLKPVYNQEDTAQILENQIKICQKGNNEEGDQSLLTDKEEKSLSLLIKSIQSGTQQAIMLLVEALKLAPNNLSAAEYLSFLYLETGRTREALSVCNAVLDKIEISNDPKNKEIFVDLQNNKAAVLNIHGRFSEAIPILQNCIHIQEKQIFVKNLADSYHFNGSYEKAINLYEKAIKLEPSYDEAHYNLSVCYFTQKNYQSAKKSICSALSINPHIEEYTELKRNIEQMLKRIKGR